MLVIGQCDRPINASRMLLRRLLSDLYQAATYYLSGHPLDKQVKHSLMVTQSFGPKYGSVGVDMDKSLRVLQLAFLPC